MHTESDPNSKLQKLFGAQGFSEEHMVSCDVSMYPALQTHASSLVLATLSVVAFSVQGMQFLLPAVFTRCFKLISEVLSPRYTSLCKTTNTIAWHIPLLSVYLPMGQSVHAPLPASHVAKFSV